MTIYIDIRSDFWLEPKPAYPLMQISVQSPWKDVCLHNNSSRFLVHFHDLYSLEWWAVYHKVRCAFLISHRAANNLFLKSWTLLGPVTK